MKNFLKLPPLCLSNGRYSHLVVKLTAFPHYKYTYTVLESIFKDNPHSVSYLDLSVVILDVANKHIVNPLYDVYLMIAVLVIYSTT